MDRSCSNCGVFNCDHLDSDWPDFCLTTHTSDADFERAKEEYRHGDFTAKAFRAAAEVEGLYYGRLTRVEEIAMFARKIGAKKIGIASCMGLMKEAQTFAKVLRAKGLEGITTVACKVGAIDKTEVGIPDEIKVHPGEHESLCNPIIQAQTFNEIGTDLNVVCGLCVGHDTIFIQHSEAPVTYLLVKDRVTCHNPAAPLYLTGSFYRRLLEPGFPAPRGA